MPLHAAAPWFHRSLEPRYWVLEALEFEPFDFDPSGFVSSESEPILDGMDIWPPYAVT